jgi:hypothetical protein
MLKTLMSLGVGEGAVKGLETIGETVGAVAKAADAGFSFGDLVKLLPDFADDYDKTLQQRMDEIDSDQQLQRDAKSGDAVPIGDGLYYYPGN